MDLKKDVGADTDLMFQFCLPNGMYTSSLLLTFGHILFLHTGISYSHTAE